MRYARIITLIILLPGCVSDVYYPNQDSGPVAEGGSGSDTNSLGMDSGSTSDSGMSNNDSSMPGMDGAVIGWCAVPWGNGYTPAYCPSFNWTDSQNKIHPCTEHCPMGYVCHVDPGNKNIPGVCQE